MFFKFFILHLLYFIEFLVGVFSIENVMLGLVDAVFWCGCVLCELKDAVDVSHHNTK